MATTVWPIRVDEEDLKGFNKRCEALEVKPTDMCRELIRAFAEGRVKIIPTTEQLKKGEIYVT